MKRVLVIDDNPDILDALDLLLSLHDYHVICAATIKDALRALNNQSIDLIIQDMNFSQGTTSGAEGKSLFYQTQEIAPNIPVIIITAWGQLDTAVELVKAGAADYLPKPWDDKKLLETIDQAIGHQSGTAPMPLKSNGLIYHSNMMTDLIAMADKVAGSDISVLITGANGCGKEKLADYIHQNSNRQQHAFVKVNMGALPSDLMEAELFGAEKGAYTGATTTRQGRFEAANGGTIFLDEIGNLSLAGQMKLLRVLQTGEFERVGSSQTISVNVRVLSATNANLAHAIKAGAFREDLYYRLNMVELNLPPLNQRKEDILPLATHFIGHDHDISPEAKQQLLHHNWPGNVRELENSCKRAIVFASSKQLLASDFFNHSLTPPQETVNEAAQLQRILDQHNWVISRAATELGLSRQALYRRIEKHQLAPKE